MIALYYLIVSWLVWLSADPATLDLEYPRAAAAVAAARASMLTETPPPPPAPDPKPPQPAPKQCENCNGRGYVVMPDGHRVVCPDCKGCPDGSCKVKSVLR